MAGHIPVDVVLGSKPGSLIRLTSPLCGSARGCGESARFSSMWEHVQREFTPRVLKALCELQYNGANFNQRNVLWMSPAFLSSSL